MTTKLSYNQILGAPVNVKDYGATGDGVTDDTAAIQAAVNAASAKGGGTVFFPTPSNNYRIESTVSIPVDVNLFGESRYTYVAVRTGTYTASAAFLINTTDGSDWVVSNPNNRTPIVRQFRIETDDTTLTAFKFSGSPVFEDIAFKFFAQSIVGSNQYNDFICLNRITCAHSTAPSTYQVELNNLGDGVLINQLHCFNVGNDPATPLKSIKVTNNAVNITNFLGGDIELANCTALTSLSNVGMDGGKIILNKTSCTLQDVALSALESEEVIQFQNDSDFTRNVVLSNVAISHDVYRDSWEPYGFDIKLANGINVDVRNVFRRIIASDNASSRNLFGVLFSVEAGTAFSAFNNRSHIYSQFCRIENEKIYNSSFDIEVPTDALFILSALNTYASSTWDAANGTYYYKIVPYWEVGRSIARTDSYGERSLALTNGGDAAILEIGNATYSGAMVLRVYRGTTTNSYDKYADVPVVDSPSLIDTGNQIAGIDWSSRGAAAVDTHNSFTLSGYKSSLGKVVIRATAAPTTGAWVQGDMVINSNPTVDGNNMVLSHWICTAAGTPGTWTAQYLSSVSPAT